MRGAAWVWDVVERAGNLLEEMDGRREGDAGG